MLTPKRIGQQLRNVRNAQCASAPLGHVNADFVQAAINAVGAFDAAQTLVGRTDEDLRQETDAAVTVVRRRG